MLREALGEELVLNSLLEAGYKKPICRVSLADKADLVSLITTYHLFIKVKAHMDCFKEGIELFGVYQYVSKYPSLLRPLFVDESIPLSASKCGCWWVVGWASKCAECVIWLCFLS